MIKYVIRVNSSTSKNELVTAYYPETQPEQYEFQDELTAYKSALNWQRTIAKHKDADAYVFVKQEEE